MISRFKFVSDLLRTYAMRETADPIVALAAEGLQLLTEHHAAIEEKCVESGVFYAELDRIIEQVQARVQAVQRAAYASGECQVIDPFNGDHQAVAFQLFECLAVMLREAHLHNILRDDWRQQDIFQHFETCGQWTPRDDAFVAHHYFKLLDEAACDQ